MSPFGKLPGFRQDQTEGSSINTLIILISMCYDYKNAAITGHFSRVTVQSEFLLRQNKTN